MKNISEQSKILYLILLIVFISAVGVFWMDYIGLFNIKEYMTFMKKEPKSVLHKDADEPSLVEREEFNKERNKLLERIEKLDKREAKLAEREKNVETELEKIEEMKKGIKLEKKKLGLQKKKYNNYEKNVTDLANKISNMPPEASIKIMEKWEDPLIIAVLREMDVQAAEAGKKSITPYLLTLFPKEKASRITYLMTQGIN